VTSNGSTTSFVMTLGWASFSNGLFGACEIGKRERQGREIGKKDITSYVWQ